MIRVYFPVQWPILQTLQETGELTGPAPGFAVTPALREWYLDENDEELEFAAFTEAVRACLELLADPDLPRRRVVLAADIDEKQSRPEPDRGQAAVRIDGVVPIDRIAAIHVDAADDEKLVSAIELALGAWEAAQNGDDDAQALVDDVEGFDLQWYATSELPSLLES